jgi:Cu-Zn family superoxide dismutase
MPVTRQTLGVALTAALSIAVACNSASRGAGAEAPHTAPPAADESTSSGSAPMPAVSVPMQARADLSAAEGSSIDGYAKFFQQADGVLVQLEVRHAPPGSKGVHVHTHGDCSDIRGESMGPHFAPKLEQHALPSEDADHHLGDLGNIDVGADGTGKLEIKVPAATLGADDSTSFLGRSLVVHGARDSGAEAQPAGNSGPPLACGVIHERGS